MIKGKMKTNNEYEEKVIKNYKKIFSVLRNTGTNIQESGRVLIKIDSNKKTSIHCGQNNKVQR